MGFSRHVSLSDGVDAKFGATSRRIIAGRFRCIWLHPGAPTADKNFARVEAEFLRVWTVSRAAPFGTYLVRGRGGGKSV